jgi:HPt (histidine-containing phosphotransfer) domain-containing protein
LSKRPARRVQEGVREEADPAIFDQEHLHQYTGGDPALERELVNLFLSHFVPVRTQLDAARSAQEWKFAAHSIKGSARSMGAPQLAALADRLDSLEFEVPKASKAQLLDELDAAMAAFASEVKKAIG